MALPNNPAERKALPVFTFLTEYFPLAFLEVVKTAVVGDAQHKNEGTKIQWARHKSADQMDCAMRHMIDHATKGPLDEDGCYHLAKAIWRLSAELQIHLEKRNRIMDEYKDRVVDNTVVYVGAPAPEPLHPVEFCPDCGDEIMGRAPLHCLYPARHYG